MAHNGALSPAAAAAKLDKRMSLNSKFSFKTYSQPSLRHMENKTSASKQNQQKTFRYTNSASQLSLPSGHEHREFTPTIKKTHTNSRRNVSSANQHGQSTSRSYPPLIDTVSNRQINSRPSSQTYVSPLNAGEFTPNYCSAIEQDPKLIEQLFDKICFLNRKIVQLEGSNNSINAKVESLENGVNSLNEQLNNLKEISSSSYKILKDLTRRNSSRAMTRPVCLPLKSTADVLAFDNITDEEFQNVVNYLQYVGGINSSDAAAKYMKSCIIMDEDLYRNVTWNGSKTNKELVALKDTYFAKACEDAMPLNKDTLNKPDRTEFSWAMTKALKSAKEAFRRKRKRAADNRNSESGEPEHQRPRLTSTEFHKVDDGGNGSENNHISEENIDNESQGDRCVYENRARRSLSPCSSLFNLDETVEETESDN